MSTVLAEVACVWLEEHIGSFVRVRYKNGLIEDALLVRLDCPYVLLRALRMGKVTTERRHIDYLKGIGIIK